MDYSIYDAHKSRIYSRRFLIREEIYELFREKVGSKYSDIIDVDYAFQRKNDLREGYNCPKLRKKPWGTGHAVWSSRNKLANSPFAVINADDFYESRLLKLFIKDLLIFHYCHQKVKYHVPWWVFAFQKLYRNMDQYPVVYVIQRMEFLKMSRNGLIFRGINHGY